MERQFFYHPSDVQYVIVRDIKLSDLVYVPQVNRKSLFGKKTTKPAHWLEYSGYKFLDPTIKDHETVSHNYIVIPHFDRFIAYHKPRVILVFAGGNEFEREFATYDQAKEFAKSVVEKWNALDTNHTVIEHGCSAKFERRKSEQCKK